MTLVEVMRLAAHRDTVASEYATGFEVTFGTAVPALERARHDGLPWDDAVVETFLTLLAAVPDTHIARRSGAALAAEVTARARAVLAAGGVRSEDGRQAHRRHGPCTARREEQRQPGNDSRPDGGGDFCSVARRGLGGGQGRSKVQRSKVRSDLAFDHGGSMQERGEFRVSVTKDYLVFASAHFITFAGHRCEGLHGHNYRASVTVEGALNKESWFVFDFVELKRIMKRLCDEIDHLVLLPLKSDRVRVVEDGESVSVSVDGKPRYVFPRKDCALLPIPNTTVEMLAQLLTERLHHELQAMGAGNLTAIEMEVEENFGQSAVYRVSLTDLQAGSETQDSAYDNERMRGRRMRIATMWSALFVLVASGAGHGAAGGAFGGRGLQAALRGLPRERDAAHAEPPGAGGDVARAHRKRAGVVQHAAAGGAAQSRGTARGCRVSDRPPRGLVSRTDCAHSQERVLHGRCDARAIR